MKIAALAALNRPRSLPARICGHEAEAEFESALLGVRCCLSSVMRKAISLLRVARSPLNAADALTPSGPAGAPTVVCDAYRTLLPWPSLMIQLAISCVWPSLV